MAADGPLAGVRVGVTGSRKGAELCAAIERRGGRALLGPTIESDRPAPDDELLPQLDALLDAAPRVLVANTGVGMRLLGEVADRHDRGRRLADLLTAAHVVARGAKAVGGLRAVGATADEVSTEESDESVVDLLRDRVAPGTTVGLQLSGRTSAAYGELEERGATIVTVRPYRVGLPADPAPAHALVRAAVDGQLDVVVLTSAIATDNLVALARAEGLWDELRRALRDGVAVASIGDVTTAALRDQGLDADVQPTRHRTGALLTALEGWAADRPGAPGVA